MASIFTKIINKELPCTEIYRDEVCMAFMDINPIGPGHLLVIPLEEKARLSELPAETAGHILKVAQTVIKAIDKSDLPSEAYNIFISDGVAAGQEVPHCHLHIVPRTSGDGIKSTFHTTATPTAKEKLEEIAEKITAHI